MTNKATDQFSIYGVVGLTREVLLTATEDEIGKMFQQEGNFLLRDMWTYTKILREELIADPEGDVTVLGLRADKKTQENDPFYSEQTDQPEVNSSDD